jgi:hypothetical protein
MGSTSWRARSNLHDQSMFRLYQFERDQQHRAEFDLPFRGPTRQILLSTVRLHNGHKQIIGFVFRALNGPFPPSHGQHFECPLFRFTSKQTPLVDTVHVANIQHAKSRGRCHGQRPTVLSTNGSNLRWTMGRSIRSWKQRLFPLEYNGIFRGRLKRKMWGLREYILRRVRNESIR